MTSGAPDGVVSLGGDDGPRVETAQPVTHVHVTRAGRTARDQAAGWIHRGREVLAPPPGPPGRLTALRRHVARRERFFVMEVDADAIAAWGAPDLEGITIRSIAPADAPALAHLTPPRQTLDRIQRGDLGTMAVRDADGRPVGCTWLATRAMDAEEHIVAVRPAPGEAYGYGLLVEPDMRERGVGRALVTANRVRGVEMGITKVLSHVVHANEPQMALQGSLGVHPTRQITTIVVLDRFSLVLRKDTPNPS